MNVNLPENGISFLHIKFQLRLGSAGHRKALLVFYVRLWLIVEIVTFGYFSSHIDLHSVGVTSTHIKTLDYAMLTYYCDAIGIAIGVGHGAAVRGGKFVSVNVG